MDPLALLCNLHGDGPTTLNRLRRAGHETLGGLEETERAALTALLGWEEGRLERFLREARQLSVRLGEGLLDPREEAARTEAPPPRVVPVVEAPAERAPEPVASEAQDDDAADEADELAPQWYEEDAAETDEHDLDEWAEDEWDEEADEALPAEMRAEVLGRWAALDEAEARGGEAADAPEPEEFPQPEALRRPEEAPEDEATLAEAGHLLVPSPPLRSPAPATPPPPPRGPEVAPVSLEDAALDGLTPARLRALREAGITTLSQLAEADDLGVHRAAGIPFTAAARLVFLARRVLREEPSLADSRDSHTGPASPEVIAGFTEGSLRTARLDAGGPFA